MSKTQATAILVLLVSLLAVAIHVGYLRKRVAAKFEYRAAEGEKIDLGSLQTAGADGWDCSVVPVVEPTSKRFLMVCKRPMP